MCAFVGPCCLFPTNARCSLRRFQPVDEPPSHSAERSLSSNGRSQGKTSSGSGSGHGERDITVKWDDNLRFISRRRVRAAC